MKNPFTFLLLGSFAFFLSCKDDEPEVDPLVGTWELEEVELVDVNGYVLLIYTQSTSSIYGEVLHEITFNDDNTYERELRFSNGKVEDSGTWEVDGDDLDLDVDEADDPDLALESFIMSGEIGEGSLTLEGSSPWPALDSEFAAELQAVIDTFTTQQSYNEVLLANIQEIEIDLILEFEKQN